MNNKWLICAEDVYRRTSQPLHDFHVKKFGNHVLLYQGESLLISEEQHKDLFVLADGYLLPRNSNFMMDQSKNITSLIADNHERGIGSIYNRVKGVFVVIIIAKNVLSVLTDHLGLYKVFYSSSSGIITNALQLVEHAGIAVDAEAIAQHDFFQHFIGSTLLKGYSILKMGTLYVQDNNMLDERHTYDLSPERFLGLSSQLRYSSDDVVEVFNKTIRNYLLFFDTDSVAMTLTGGGDTRAILAALMNLGVKPNCFTFGSPRSRDVLSSSRIARGLNLPFNNLAFNNMTAKQYANMVTSVIDLGNPLIHIHRAHRLESAKRQYEQNPSHGMVFMGCMGGDLIKGVHLNDYIISEYVRRHYFGNESLSSVFKSMLQDRFFISGSIDRSHVLSVMEAISFEGLNRKQTEFNFAIRLIGTTHDYQDIFLFNTVFERCVVPFFDIDFVEALFASEMNLFFCNRTSSCIKDQLRNHGLQIYITHKLYPELLGYNYANGYSGNDFMYNRKMYFMKRGMVYCYDKLFRPVPNFPYNKWFVQYLQESLQKIELIGHIYDINKLKLSLQDIDRTKRNEGYFHKFSNPLNHALYISKYL